ncbi:hemerythrin domain-containing protein [Flaviaesturariibacter flavus]|uniref:Hemerythrin domain-containing protein n=1 Tax=Flaviaesturariibacter flavus TaxID=2502780 RepID=A0A4V2NV77_9BACT|nr:hemerythrin domain-containing protein [Flaviaesturariibacter flavus]TCJ12466.1 hemerythrin domain-containing protein [Flaviaesturariibacter flavus]
MAPIKRSAQLAPLSREHHEGLLLSWKIRQGLARAIDAKRISAYLQWFWETELADHFRREEAAFHPVLPGAPLLARMQEEHEEIEGLIHVDAQIPDADLLGEIAQKVTDHIRFEERELFPWIEAQLGDEKLTALQAIVDRAKGADCPAWTDDFWTNSR